MKDPLSQLQQNMGVSMEDSCDMQHLYLNKINVLNIYRNVIFSAFKVLSS